MLGEDKGINLTYRIGELSRITGVKEGTIRFYEKCGFVGPVERTSNNYRLYRRRHIYQIRVCRLVFGGFVNRRLRRESRKVLETSARWDLAAYGEAVANYQRAVEEDIEGARKAIAVCVEQMSQICTERMGQICTEQMSQIYMEQMGWEAMGQRAGEELRCSKKQAAVMVGVTPEAIRNWERNGLLGQCVPYQKRFYGQALLNRMYVIRLLLDTGYSMMAIKGFMQEWDSGQPKSAERLLISPKKREELRYRSDRYLEALLHVREKARQLCELKAEMEKFF